MNLTWIFCLPKRNFTEFDGCGWRNWVEMPGKPNSVSVGGFLPTATEPQAKDEGKKGGREQNFYVDLASTLSEERASAIIGQQLDGVPVDALCWLDVCFGRNTRLLTCWILKQLLPKPWEKSYLPILNWEMEKKLGWRYFSICLALKIRKLCFRWVVNMTYHIIHYVFTSAPLCSR